MHPSDPLENVSALSDITIVDVTQVGAGPFAAMTLGDMGADVIKIEAVGRGDRLRASTPSPEYFDMLNRNKRSIELDLKSERGQEVAATLIEDADVFLESAKPGRIDRFNLAYGDVREINPSIIYCSIKGFGSDSPYEDVPAFDMLIQAMSGFMSMTGTPDTPPLWSGLTSGDLAASMYTVQSVLLALYARESGQIESEWIEVPMFDAAISWLWGRAAYAFAFDEPFPRTGTYHPNNAPFGVFSCADAEIVIAASGDALWNDLCEAIDREDLYRREEFDTAADRVENREALREELESTLSERPADEWIDRLHSHQVPAGPIYDTVSVWDDEHVQQRDLRVTMERDDRDDAEVIDHPVHFSNLATTLRTPPQQLGESTDDLLASHGYSEAMIQELRDEDVIG